MFDERSIILNWHEQGRDYLFGPHQLSDGALRTIALVTAILHPQKQPPAGIVIDEPELGLHPYAIAVIAALMRSSSQTTQILVSTQSVTFLEQFDAHDVVVVERDERGTLFRRLDDDGLQSWLDEYSLGELWEKNVIGGRPGG